MTTQVTPPNLKPSTSSAAANSAGKPASKKSKGKEKETTGNASTKTGKSKSPKKSSSAGDKQGDRTGYDSWAWKTLADSSVSDRPVVFTPDGNYFFSAVGSSVRIYSSSSGKVVSTLSSSSSGGSGSHTTSHGGHTDRVTSVILNPENQYQIITASLDGCIKIWDFLDAVLLRTIDVGAPIYHMCAHKEVGGKVFVATKTIKKPDQETKDAKDSSIIFCVSLTPDPTTTESGFHKPAEMIFIGKTRRAASIALSHDGSYLIAIGGFKSYVAMTSSLEKGFTKFVSPERLKCLACHPSDDFFATGDEKGVVRLWYCLNDQIGNMASGVEKRAQTTTLHWHAHSISALAFTPNGAYLLSGGEESVLVIWQLHSGKKEFVPRMGSPILNVAVRNGREEEYLMGLSDGSYVFVGASTLSVSRTIPRVKLGTGKASYKVGSAPFAFHRQSSTIILPSSHPSSLQLYSPNSSLFVGEVEVAPSNRVSKRDEKAIEPFVVEKVAVSTDGKWMATVDKRENEEDFSTEIHLKIWQWDSKSWILNTRIDRPHGSEALSSISFSPKNDDEALLLTAGLDGIVKTWRERRIATKSGESESFWVNRSQLQFRSEKPIDACWSSDSSLLAICFQPHIVLVDPRSNIVLDTLDAIEVKVPSRIRFLGSGGRYLLVSSNKDVVLWDLVSRSVRWTTYTTSHIAHVLPHPTRDIVALILHPYAETMDKRISSILVYSWKSPKATLARSVPFRLRALTWYPDHHDMSLVGLTDDWNLMLFGDKVSSLGDAEYTPRRIDKTSKANTQRTLFEDVFGASALAVDLSSSNTEFPQNSTQDVQQTHNALAKFNAPAYLAHPIDSIYSSLMDHFVSKTPERGTTSDKLEDDKGETMIVDQYPPTAAVPLVGRNVDDEEFDGLVSLFRSQALSRLKTKKSTAHGTSNGKHKARLGNGNSHVASSPSTAPNGHISNGAPPNVEEQIASTETESSTSPVAVGKKRKTGQIS